MVKEKDVVVKIYGRFKYLLYSILFGLAFAFYLWEVVQYVSVNGMTTTSAIIRMAIIIIPLFLAVRAFLIFVRQITFCKDKFVVRGLFSRREFLYENCEFNLMRYRIVPPGGGGAIVGFMPAAFFMEQEICELTIITDKENCRGIKFSSKHYRKFEEKLDMNLFDGSSK